MVPTAFRYNPGPDSIDIGGHDFAKRKKYRDVLRNPKVALVIDDIASVNPGEFVVWASQDCRAAFRLLLVSFVVSFV